MKKEQFSSTQYRHAADVSDFIAFAAWLAGIWFGCEFHRNLSIGSALATIAAVGLIFLCNRVGDELRDCARVEALRERLRRTCRKHDAARESVEKVIKEDL